MNDLFDYEIAQASAEFIALRDHPNKIQEKRLVQKMWQTFAAWADPEFPQQFARNVHTRFWEMYLGVSLFEKGFQLVQKQSSLGPDFHILLDDRHLWIEATAPGEGTGEDAVQSIYKHEGYEPIPDDSIILRFTNAISSKVKQRQDYIRDGVMGPDDAYVIALNGGGIGMTLFEGPFPNIVKSVYSVGKHYVHIDKNTLEITQEGYEPKLEIPKLSGSAVSINTFLDPNYSGISGIIYSDITLPRISAIAESKFLYVDCFVANIHFPIGWFGPGEYYYWVEPHSIRTTHILA